MVFKKGPAKMSEKAFDKSPAGKRDDAMDKKRGIKEDSSKDKAIDAKAMKGLNPFAKSKKK